MEVSLPKMLARSTSPGLTKMPWTRSFGVRVARGSSPAAILHLGLESEFRDHTTIVINEFYQELTRGRCHRTEAL